MNVYMNIQIYEYRIKEIINNKLKMERLITLGNDHIK